MNASAFFHVHEGDKLSLSLGEDTIDERLVLSIKIRDYPSVSIFAPRDTMIGALTEAFDRFIAMGEAAAAEAEKEAVAV